MKPEAEFPCVQETQIQPGLVGNVLTSSISGNFELLELQNETDQDHRRLETSVKKPMYNTGICLRCVPLLELDMNPNLEISASAIASLPFVGGLVSRPVVILR